MTIEVTQAQTSYAAFQQQRGRLPDLIEAAIEIYDGFMADDDYNAQGCLDKVVAKLRTARDWYPTATQPAAAEDEVERVVSAVDAFDMGFAWAMSLQGQTLEDSRAVGRTLFSDLFEPIAEAIQVEEAAQGFNSFRDADYGICQAKRIIKAAIARAAIAAMRPGQQWQPIETAPKDGTVVDLWGLPLAYSAESVRIADCYFENGAWRTAFNYLDQVYSATHWRPEPAPPVAACAKQGGE